MTLEERAEALADYANECCGRSDGYWDDVKTQALEHLRAVVEACAEVAERYAEKGYSSGHISEEIRREGGE